MKTFLGRSLFSRLILFFSLTMPVLTLFSQESGTLPFPIHHYTLQNGLEVILSEDHSLPIVSVVVGYKVGSVYEAPGKAGLSYLLENLMFQGSKNVGRMQHFSFINRTGGRLSGYTTEDKTIFYQTIPSNRLELAFWLESDRMLSLDIKEYKVEQAKQTLIEEISQRKQRDPYLESSLAFDELIYQKFPQSHPVFGYETDLKKISVDDVRNFYTTYYVPNNAVLCITGFFERNKTIELVQKYFGSIPPGKSAAPSLEPDMPPLEPSSNMLEKSFVPSPGFHLGYRIPPPHSPEFYPIKIIEYLLVKGKSSRIFDCLQKKERIAVQWTGYIDIRDGLASLKFFVLNSNDILAEKSLKAISSSLTDLKSDIFLVEEEINKAKNMFRSDYLNQFSSSLNKALFLSESFLYRRSLDHLPGELDKFTNVTPYEILRMLNRYLMDKGIVLRIQQR
ncbi:MAG: insulinase family protein [Candidatus Aminicenantes bacterium]|nr:insulinase family protein [Candidatus Aminicenantes bacterium]